MESPNSNANPQALSDGVSSKSLEEKSSPSTDDHHDASQSIGEDAPLNPPEVTQPMEDFQMVIPDQDREYGCKYCHKKFTNKQALGGHQNAHKIERAMEKNVRDVQENNFGYFGPASSYPGGMTSPTPFLSSYHRSHDFMNRSIVNWPYPSQQPLQHGIHIGYNSRPVLPMAAPPYGPRPFQGFNNVYSGFSAPVPRIPQFTGPPPYMPNQALNLRFSNIGGSAGSSSSFRPASQGPSTFAGPSRRPDRNPGGGNNNGMNDPGDQQVDDSGLDLSLKL